MLKTEAYFVIVLMLVQQLLVIPSEVEKPRGETSVISRDPSTLLRMTSLQLHREINCGDHAVGPRDSFPGYLECSPVIRARARQGEAQRYVHAAVERVQLQRNQSLVVIHAKHRVEFAFNRSVENGVRRNRTGENEWRMTSDH